MRLRDLLVKNAAKKDAILILKNKKYVKKLKLNVNSVKTYILNKIQHKIILNAYKHVLKGNSRNKMKEIIHVLHVIWYFFLILKQFLLFLLFLLLLY